MDDGCATAIWRLTYYYRLQKLPQTEEAALMQGYQLIKNYPGFRRRGRPKKKGNLAIDKIVVVSARAARNPVSERKRPSV